ncbi:MAG: hypothetical protein AAFR58_12560 [Cyanobacteria bacterium J06627_28]
MWHPSSSLRLFNLRLFNLQFPPNHIIRQKALAALFGSGTALTMAVVCSESALAQRSPNEGPPTARYAQGEDVDLADIISEWRGYYPDVPVYQCICQDSTCDQTEQWPYRNYDRYQLGVALGPTNGQVAEAAGSNCFDIADGSRPGAPRTFSTAQADANEEADAPITDAPITDAPITEAVDDVSDEVSEPASQPPEPAPSVNSPVATDSPPPIVAPVGPVEPAAPVPSPAASGIPVATTINDGADIRLDWPSGVSNVINVASGNWTLNILDAVDCPTLSLVDQKVMAAQRVVGTPAVDEMTGNVAVPVLLDSCVDVDQSAVFVLDPTEGGGYALYRTQLPGNRNFPNEFSSYSFSGIDDVRYLEGSLLVRQFSNAGSRALMIFRAGNTPAGAYAGCGVVTVGEGASVLCNQPVR